MKKEIKQVSLYSKMEADGIYEDGWYSLRPLRGAIKDMSEHCVSTVAGYATCTQKDGLKRYYTISITKDTPPLMTDREYHNNIKKIPTNGAEIRYIENLARWESLFI